MFVGYSQVAATATEKGADSFIIPPAFRRGGGMVYLQADTQDVRYTMDGNSHPGQSVGMVLKVGLAPEAFFVEDFMRIRFVRGAGTDGVLNAHFAANTAT